MKFPTNEIVEAIASVLPERRPIGHHEAWYDVEELQSIERCLESGIAGYQSINLFEERLAGLLGVRHVIAVASGTAALHASLVGLDLPPHSTVLCPGLTFGGTASAIIQAGHRPYFIDGRITVNIHKLRTLLKRLPAPPAAIIGVDLLGHPADWPALEELADAIGCRLLEDACQALGSSLHGRACGQFSDVAVFSFNNNKIATTNGGGCVATNDDWLATRIRHLATTGRVVHPFLVEHDLIGFNYRMGAINAAFGLAQLERLPLALERKRGLHDRYSRCLAPYGDAVYLVHCDAGECNYWLNAILIHEKYAGQYIQCRDSLLTALHDNGILARAMFTPLHMLSIYGDCQKDNMGYAEDTWKRCICLPSGAGYERVAAD